MSLDYHIPVLLKESIDLLIDDKDGIYVDVTFGGGSHSREILSRLTSKGSLYSLDQDEDAKRNKIDDKRFTFIQSNFAHLKNHLRANGVSKVDGILADLGVSSFQFDEAERGFSYRFDAALDMRMNQLEGLTAADFLNTSLLDDLIRVLGQYGEVRNTKTLANAIIAARQIKPIKTTKDLLLITEKMAIGDKVKYNSQVFQALRIEVNEELKVLKEFLLQALEVLKENGRLVVLSYHSLEDRLVKNFLKSGNFKGEFNTDFYGNIDRPFTILTKNAITADEIEIHNNPRSRSVKMRCGTKN